MHSVLQLNRFPWRTGTAAVRISWGGMQLHAFHDSMELMSSSVENSPAETTSAIEGRFGLEALNFSRTLAESREVPSHALQDTKVLRRALQLPPSTLHHFS